VRKNDCPTSYSLFCVSLSHQQKLHQLSFLCFTVPPALKRSHSPYCASLSHQQNMYIPPVWWLTVPFTKIHVVSFSCLIVPLALKCSHSLLCVSLSHQQKLHPLSFFLCVLLSHLLLNADTLLIVSHCTTSKKYFDYCYTITKESFSISRNYSLLFLDDLD
jgi:hypothetical protein